MKRFSVFFLFYAFCFSITAQNLKENTRMAQDIQRNISNYYYGFGDGNDANDATQKAMQNLLGSISSKIINDIKVIISNKQEGAAVASSSEMQAYGSVCSAGYLRGIHTLILANPPQCRIMAYITRAQVDSIYKSRRERAVQFYIDAMNNEKVGNIDDALRCYYWGLCLVKSMDDPASVKYNDGYLLNLIPSQIKEILRNLKTEVAEVNGQDVKLLTTYRGKPVGRIGFRYHDGLRLGDIEHTVKDGMSLITLVKSYSEKVIDLHYELVYKNEVRNDPEMEVLMNMYGKSSFPDAHVSVEMGDKKRMSAAKVQFEMAAQEEATPTEDFMKRGQSKNYTKTVLAIAEAICSKQYESVKDDFTSEGYEMFNRLLKYGQAEILTIPELHCFTYRDKVICRSIPMRFSYKGNKRVFVEDVTFTFNNDGLIESLAFGLDRATREQIYTERHLKAWGDSTCTMLATFLENYKTAFALHRLDYIRDIFSNFATIIVGHTVKPIVNTTKGDERKIVIRTSGARPRYTEMDKNEYMNRLEACFNRNEFINIHLTDCIIGKMFDERFGINIHQDYFSSTYSDTGFLYLLVDVSNPETPIIQYRSWQPNRDPALNNKVKEDDPLRGLVTSGIID